MSTQYPDDESTFRKSVTFKTEVTFTADENENHSESMQHQIVFNKRGAFRWLPLFSSNDLVAGSWYYVWGSLLCILIPCFPLIHLFETLWSSHSEAFLPLEEDAAVYSMLIFMGVMYTIGSYAFLRAVETPRVHPLSTWYHFQSDELLGMWTFFWGTAPSVPIMAIYAYYYPGDVKYAVALALSCLFTACFFGAALACYPRKDYDPEAPVHWIYVFCPCLKYREYLAPVLLHCIPSSWTSLRKHVANDWLVVSWGVLVCCIFSVLICCGLLRYAVLDESDPHIYDYSTGLVDMVVFTIGSMYFVAGSYPDEIEGSHPYPLTIHELQDEQDAAADLEAEIGKKSAI
jgi:hypothetical protein